MAIAFVSNRANLNFTSAVGANSMPMTNPDLITPGNTIFLQIYAKTAAASLVPAVACGATVTDPRGNTWVAETCQSSNDGVNGHGGMLLFYRCLVVTPYLAGDALSIVGQSAGLQVLYQIEEFSGVSQGPHAIYTAANFGVSATTAANLPVTVSAAGQLVIVTGCVGTDNNVVTDADTTDGTWSTAFRRTLGTINNQMWESHKILTGLTAGTQNYNATWTSSGGDNNYAQMALVYDPSFFGPATQQFPPQDNPNFGCPDEGFEPMPTSTAKVPVDTGTAYQIEHTIPAYSAGTHYYSAVAQYDDTETAIQQHHIAYDLYQTGSEVPQDTVTQLTFPVGVVNLLSTGSARVYSGADALVATGPQSPSANGLAALQGVGGNYIALQSQTYEVQSLTEGGSGLTSFTVTVPTFGTTGSIAAAATPTTVQSALESLVGVGNVLVTSTNGTGGPYIVQFTGTLSFQNLAPMTTTPTGGSGTVTVATITNGSLQGVLSTQFDLTNGTYNIANYANSRIVRIGVRFAAWKDNSSTLAIPVGEGLELTYSATMPGGSTYETEVGAWLTPDYKRSASQQLRWFGEQNPLPKVPNATSYYGAPGNQWFRTWPDGGTSWSYADVLALAVGGSDFLKCYGLPGADFSQVITYLDFLELVIEVAPERRLGNAIQNVSTSPIYSFSPLPASQYSPGRAAIIQLRSVLNQATPLVVSGSPNDYQLVAREALPGSSSDYYPALATAPGAPAVGGVVPSSFIGLQLYCPAEALGPSLCYNGYTQPRTMSPNQRPLTVRTVVDGVFAAPAGPMEQYELSFGALDYGNFLSAGSMFPVFHGMAPINAQQVYSGHSQTQRMYVQSGTTVDQVRVVCRPDPLTTAPLAVVVPGIGNALITPALARAGEDIGYGWFVVTAPVTPGTFGSTAVITITMSSVLASSGAPWFVSSVQAIGPAITLAFEPFAQNSGNAVNSYAVTLECTMVSPSVTLGTSTISMDPVNKATCRASSYDVPTLTISNSSSFDRLIVERSVDAGLTWTVATRVVDPSSGLVFIDEECPWDVGGAISVIYRVTGYRDSDRRSTSTTTGNWSGLSSNPGAAFGLSSNQAGFSVAYVPADPNQVQVTWNPLNPVTTVQLHDVDYQYALRIPENRGLSVSVPVLVDQISYCCMPTTATTLTAGFDSSLISFDDSGVVFDASTMNGTSVCALDQQNSITNYGELLQKGGQSMSPRPYERDILNVFNSSAVWILKLPGGHTRFVTAQVGAMAITPAAGVYMAELTLIDVTPPSADPYDE